MLKMDPCQDIMNGKGGGALSARYTGFFLNCCEFDCNVSTCVFVLELQTWVHDPFLNLIGTVQTNLSEKIPVRMDHKDPSH